METVLSYQPERHGWTTGRIVAAAAILVVVVVDQTETVAGVVAILAAVGRVEIAIAVVAAVAAMFAGVDQRREGLELVVEEVAGQRQSVPPR